MEFITTTDKKVTHDETAVGLAKSSTYTSNSRLVDLVAKSSNRIWSTRESRLSCIGADGFGIFHKKSVVRISRLRSHTAIVERPIAV
mgnify:CR=1 FL=1